MIEVITGPGTGVSLSDVWPLLAVMFGGIAAVFGFLVKHIGDLRTENKELRDKLMNDVVPAMTENTVASKSMVEAAVKMQATLAVAEDRQSPRRGPR